MAFNIENFGSDTSNAKSMLGGIKYFRYFNKNSDTITNNGYFPADLGLDIGDRICVIPSSVLSADEWYVVSSIVNRKVTVSKIDSFDPSKKFLEQFVEMPEASEDNVGRIVQYIGSTGTYTQGYIYKNKVTTLYTDTTTFSPASISGTEITATDGAVSSLASQYIQADITKIVKGTLTYDSQSNLWVFVGKDAENNTVGTFQLYTNDYEDAGFTFTGTPEDDDVSTFTCTIERETTYAWTRINVQPTE